MKQQWFNWVSEVCSVNQSDRSYQLSSYWLMQLILLIVYIFINCIHRVVLNFSALQLKANSSDPTNSGMTFWTKKGKFWRLLAFTGIYKDFTRSVWEINEILLGVITSVSPWIKFFTLWNRWGSNTLTG